MLQVARLAGNVLGEAASLVTRFLLEQMNEDGGFRDRSGKSDLYYTVFGLEGLLALRADLPASRAAAYLKTFGGGAGLDLVHLAALARCWADLPPELRAEAPRQVLLERLECFRAPGGGYGAGPGAEEGTVYGCLLALGACQDLGAEPPRKETLLDCVRRLQAADGGFSNRRGASAGITTATAAAAALFRHLDAPAPSTLESWILERAHPRGGFAAAPGAPIPDLLSTATALHALAGLQAPVEGMREVCLDFVDSLWTNRGGFYGHWADDALDCEYTYYALLALGHLSL